MDSTTVKPTLLKQYWWAMLVGIGVLFTIGLSLFLYFRARAQDTADLGSDETADNVQNDDEDNGEEETCNASSIEFTAEFTNLTQINYVAPLGGITTGSAGRSYVFVKAEDDGTYPLVPVYAPTNSTVTGLVYAKRGGTTSGGEYRVEADTGCGIRYFFDHLDDINDELQAYTPQTPSEQTNDVVYVSVPVTAGTLLGYSNGTDQAHAWDFSVMDANHVNPFINPSRWEYEQNKNAVCPYDFYSEPLKSQYYAALAYWDGSEIEPLNCGNPSHDIADTLSGGWFQGDATDSTGNHIIVGSFGEMVEVIIDDNADNHERLAIRDYTDGPVPEDITTGEIVCYSDGSNYVFFQLVSDTSLNTVTDTGNCPDSFPSQNVANWER